MVIRELTGLFVEIISYSFEPNSEQFYSFIKIFKKINLEKHEKLLSNKFNAFLYEILSQHKMRSPLFFKSLKKSTTLIEQALQLLNEDKISEFNEATIK